MNQPRLVARVPALVAVTLALSGLCAPADRLNAQEICGIPEVRRLNDFEADSLPAPVVFASNAPLTVTVDPSHGGSSVPGPTTAISGTYSGPPGTGVSARGRAAVRAGNRWVIPNVPLNAGSNSIVVTAVTLAGATSSQTVVLTRDDAPAQTARLSVTTPFSYAGSLVGFRLQTSSSLAAARLRVDFDGNGTFDVDSANVSVPLKFRFALPGVYVANATIDLAPVGGQTPPPVLRSALVVVQHRSETRSELCAAFGTMRTRLAANDIPGAALALHPRIRSSYQSTWTSLGAALPGVAAQLGTIVDGTLSASGFAELVIARPVAGQTGQLRAYRVQFDRGPDGVWRIGSM